MIMCCEHFYEAPRAELTSHHPDKFYLNSASRLGKKARLLDGNRLNPRKQQRKSVSEGGKKEYDSWVKPFQNGTKFY